MNIELIYNEIAELLKMAEAWSADGEVSDIERDIALDKVKRLYEQLRFTSPATPIPPKEVEEVEEEGSEIEIELTYYEVDEEQQQDEQQEYDDEQTEEQQDDIEAEVYEEEEVYEEDDDEPLIPFELIDISIIPDNENESEEEVADVEETVEIEESEEENKEEENKEEVAQQEPLTMVTPTENALFDITTIPIRQKSRRSAILSLYNDDEPYVAQPAPQPQSRPSTIEIVKELEIVETIVEEPTIEPTFVTTIADRYAEQMPSGTIASSSAAWSSINDRYIICEELFGGDMQACEAMFASLEQIDNFDDGMIYIIENYDWNPDCEGTKLVIKLLEQRFLNPDNF